MTSTDELVARWNSPDYQALVDVQLEGDQMIVQFENGDVVQLARDHLLPPRSSKPDWTKLAFDRFEIEVPTDGEKLEVSWLDLRVLSDPDFAAHLAQEADAEARRIGLRLRSLREARHLSSRELAERAGITPQSLSRIELGRHDVVFTTLQRLLAAMGHDLRDLAAVQDPPLSSEAIVKSLRKSGLDRDLIRRLTVDLERQPERIVTRVRRIFGWTTADLISGATVPFRASPAFAGRFKSHAKSDPAQAAYVMYAHYLSLLVAHATPTRPIAEIDPDPAAIRAQILADHRDVSFLPLLDWVWNNGVPVLPLAESGQFHGACWRTNGAAVICLKQKTPLDSRWAFDLAHELGHVVLHLRAGEPSVVEIDEIAPFAQQTAREEQEANDFAETLLIGDAEELAHTATSEANGRVDFLKRAVVVVADRQRVDPGVLANYMAYRLSMQGIDWWGAATNLQKDRNDAAERTREHLYGRIDWEALGPDDSTLVTAALGDEG